MTDIALFQTESQFFDFEIENGDFKFTQGLDSAILTSLFLEKRADKSEVPRPELRRGWIGNLSNQDPTFEKGSKLWQLEQARLNQDSLNKAVNEAQLSLQWLVDDGLYIEIRVSGEIRRASDSIRLQIVFVQSASETETRFFDLLINTGDTIPVRIV